MLSEMCLLLMMALNLNAKLFFWKQGRGPTESALKSVALEHFAHLETSQLHGQH